MTTSTIYSTHTYTITKCPVTVTNCPADYHKVTTVIIAVSTTVCPIEEAESTAAPVTVTEPCDEPKHTWAPNWAPSWTQKYAAPSGSWPAGEAPCPPPAETNKYPTYPTAPAETGASGPVVVSGASAARVGGALVAAAAAALLL